ncbi:MAG: UvrD-helicase domain-containing protein [Actinomycetota bacterium]|nr:UvrD-helicase domain-containing protein [Actinomycetota bacterium]
MDEQILDQEERIEITREVFKNHFVVAGAGAGKTSSMISRVVNSIEAGVEIGQILAITFTEAAANEIKVRLRRELISRMRKPDTPQELSSKFRGALAGLNLAPIGTIHSFANSIISRYPLEAGLPIVFGTTDPSSKAKIFDLAIRGYYDELAATPQRAQLHELFSRFGFEESNVVDLVKEIDETFVTISLDGDYLSHLSSALTAFESLEIDRFIEEALDRLSSMARICVTDSDSLLEVIRSTFVPNLRLLTDSGFTFDRVFKLLALTGQSEPKKLFTKLPKNKGQAPNWGGTYAKKQLIEEFNDFVDLVQEAILEKIDELIRVFVLDVAMAAQRERMLRQSMGKITFSDQIRLCYELLLGADESLVSEIARTYKVILIDEFQDTDPVQVAIFDRIASLSGAALFFVGDPRQSIYRFRGADPATYLEVASRDHARIALRSNFRSHPSVVAWVNEIFETTFAANLNFKLAPMLSARRFKRAEAEVVSVIKPCTVGEERRSASQRRAAQAKSVAYLVREYLDQEIEVDGEVRLARPSDIAVLFPTRSVLGSIRRSLGDIGVPHRSIGGASIVDEPYIAEILLFLRAAFRPFDQLALVQLLQSESVGMANERLQEYVGEDRFSRAVSTSRENLAKEGYQAANLVEELLSALEDLRVTVRDLSLAEGVNLVARRFSILENGFRDSGEEFLRHYDTFLGYCKDFDSRGLPAESFVSYVEGIVSERQTLTEAEGRDVESDAVRLMTIHASKGLEFPIVIVVATASGNSSRSSASILASSAERITLDLESLSNTSIAVKLNSRLKTSNFDEVMKSEDIADDDEEVRLFYVAATRAMNTLAVVLEEDTPPTKSGESKNSSKVHNRLFKIDGIDARELFVDDLEVPIFNPKKSIRTLKVDAAERERLLRLVAERVGRKWRATASIELETHGGSVEDGGGADSSRERSIQVGIAVHRFLASYVNAKVNDVDQGSGTNFDELETEEMRTRARRAVEHFTAWLDRFDIGASTRRALAEFPFSVHIDGVLNEGIIDLAFIDGGSIQVVDYKVVGASTESQVEALIDHYRIQADFYRRSLEAIYPSVNVLSPIFLFSTPIGLLEQRYEKVI